MRSPRASKNVDTARDTRHNRSATLGPIAPTEKKFQMKRTFRTTDRDATESPNASPAAEAETSVWRFPGPARKACARSMPFPDSSSARIASVNSPARRFPAARCVPACRACPSLTNPNEFRRTRRAETPWLVPSCISCAITRCALTRSVVNPEKRCQPKKPDILEQDSRQTRLPLSTVPLN